MNKVVKKLRGRGSGHKIKHMIAFFANLDLNI